jgi:hypothetical protein
MVNIVNGGISLNLITKLIIGTLLAILLVLLFNKLKRKNIYMRKNKDMTKANEQLKSSTKDIRNMTESKIVLVKTKENKDMTKANEQLKSSTKDIRNMTSSEILQCASWLVVIKEIYAEDEKGKEKIIYLLKIADIDIRIYISYLEVHTDANYLRAVIRKIVTDKAGKVEIVELKTEKTYYLLKIAGFDIKTYLSIEEASRVTKYMEIVVKKILEMA